MKTAVRTGMAIAATAAVLLTAACGSDSSDEPTTETTTDTSTETSSPEESAPAETAAPTEIPDVTLLILETAQSNLMQAGLEADILDESGATPDTSDATQWVVVEQDPEGGSPYVDGVTVTLTVRER